MVDKKKEKIKIKDIIEVIPIFILLGSIAILLFVFGFFEKLINFIVTSKSSSEKNNSTLKKEKT